jgi:glycyl-tRNA synthetase beta chain
VHIQTNLFEGDAERGLFSAMRKAAPKVEEHKRAGHYKEALDVIAALRPEVDRFFELVMVMAENEAVRKNRLALLSELFREFSTIADFSEMAGENKN